MLKNPDLRNEFIENNLGLVHTVCKRFSGKGIEYDDLYQSGCMGLVKAYDAFDEKRGLCFSTYAVPVIMGEVRRLFRDGGSIKVSRSVKELGMKIAREKNKFEQFNSREPTVGELAYIIGVSPEEIAEAVCANQTTVSLTAENDDESVQMDIPCVSEEDEITERIMLDEAFERLDEVEKRIIKHRYFSALTQSKTAKILNMSQVQVSRAEKKILLKLREILK